MKRGLIPAAWLLTAIPALAQSPLIARARSLELSTPYVPPPGDPLEHHAAGFAKIICSAVFVTGLAPEFAAENLGFFTAPYEERAKLGRPAIDRVRKAVRVTSRLPDAATQPWPMGDLLPSDRPGAELDTAKVRRAVDAAFEPAEAMTAALVVTWQGRIVGERYGHGITTRTPLESWSMGKSITATLMGVLIRQGVYDLSQPAPVPEWRQPGDPRAKIRIADLLNMSSGLRIRAPQDPDYDPSGPYPDHVYLYTGGINSFHYAATRPLQWPPGTVGRYRNTDPVLVNYLIRLAVEQRGEDYLAFPRRALFDKLGMRSVVIETDPYGDFLTQGYDFASARDWARLGNLYLQDGVWNGERILPEGFVRFVSTVAPAWAADGRPIYGGFFWINGDGDLPIPRGAYFMAGAGGQFTIIIPSHDLVVVRQGHYRGATIGTASLKKALALLVTAVPGR